MKLEYAGKPLACIIPLPNTPSYWLWMALWDRQRLTLPCSSEMIDHLIAEGWVQDTSFDSDASILETQLYETATLVKEENQSLIYFYRPDRDARPPVPVVLTFSIERFNGKVPSVDYIPMLNPFPLPQFGEYAYVGEESDKEMALYHILQLPLAARRRWAMLGDKLRAISAPSLWPLFTERHVIASDETTYQEAIQILRNQQRLAIGQAQSALVVKEALLRAARMHIESLRETLKKHWQDSWQEIQIMVRDLARDYYQYHLSLHPIEISVEQETATVPEPDTFTAPTQEEGAIMQASLFSEESHIVETKKKERHPALPPQRIIARRNDYVQTRADSVQREIVRMLRIDKSLLTLYPGQGIARYVHDKFYKDKGQFVFDIGDGQEAWQTVIDTLNMLGDGMTDTWIALLAMGIDQNGVEHLTSPFLLNPDDILALCGKEKSHRSYTPYQRAEIIKNLKALSLCRIRATFPAPGYAPGEKRRGRLKRGESRNANGDTVIIVEGAFVDLLSFKIGEYNTITGEEIWERQSVAIGTWAKAVPGLSNQTAIMLRQVLRYSAKNQRFQKRIGTYLTMMFRANARYGGKFPHGISTYALLEGSGIVIGESDWKNPGRFKERIENALKELKNDSVIGDFWQEVDASPTIGQDIKERASGWIHLWLEQKWNFAPPEAVTNHYAGLLKEANSNGLQG